MCNGKFFGKEPDQALTFFDYLAESAQQWHTQSDRTPLVVQPHRAIGGGGKYEIKENTNVQASIGLTKHQISLFLL